MKIFRPSRYKVPVRKLVAFAQKILESYSGGDLLVNIIFVGKRRMIGIASAYKNEFVALPVLSFAFEGTQADNYEPPLLGEVYICYPQAVLLAAEKEKSVDAILEQLIEHGIRNLAG